MRILQQSMCRIKYTLYQCWTNSSKRQESFQKQPTLGFRFKVESLIRWLETTCNVETSFQLYHSTANFAAFFMSPQLCRGRFEYFIFELVCKT
jgi:hypothetical protein